MTNVFQTMSEPNEVVKLVQRILDRIQPRGFKLRAKEAFASPALKQWVVFVDTEPEEVSGVEYAKKIVETEDKLAEDERIEGIVLNPPLWRPD
jgi:hypothetical protein